MKIRLSPAFLAALLLAGCSKNDNIPDTVAAAAASGPAAAAAAPTPMSTGTPAATAATPAAAPVAAATPSAGARVIEITANDQMRFSVTTMEAKAGEQLKVVLTNIGTLPKEAMGHNWVLLKEGTDPMAFAAASMTAKDHDYISPSLKDQVIAHIPVLGPKKTGDVSFKAPAPGVYPFLCSFPGHVALMKGTLTVK